MLHGDERNSSEPVVGNGNAEAIDPIVSMWIKRGIEFFVDHLALMQSASRDSRCNLGYSSPNMNVMDNIAPLFMLI